MDDIQKQVDEINSNINTIGLDDCIQQQYCFSMSDKMLELIEKSPKEEHLWGTVKNHCYYAAEQAKELQWIPRKLVYVGYDERKCPEENGTHTFVWICEDRSMKYFWNFIQNINESTVEKPMKLDTAQWRILESMESKYIVTSYKEPSGIKGFWRGIPFEVI